MDRALRVLHLEDDAGDAGVVSDVLELGGIVCDITRVQTREAFVASLERGGLDLILADYSLPSFDGMSALKIAAQRSPDVPFIFVSGMLGEELAVQALKLGATDYVLKERLSRIVSAVRGALREAQHRAERKQAEQALRESEERFRTLVQFSFDGYWESDAQHRFIRQDFADALPTAPEIGKTRWEVPHLEPDEEAWREHRATLDAHLPFRDFELARPTPDGGKRYFSISGLPVFDEARRFIGYRGVARHITERKLAEEERRAHLRFLESMDRINRAIQGSNGLERMMSEVLNAVLEVFGCDRAWLIYPCDPHAPSWRAVMEHTRPEYPGAFALQTELPVDTEVAAVFAAVRASSGAVQFHPHSDLKVPAQVAERFAIRSQIVIAVHPKGDQPYLFGLHQCSYERVWTAQEERLFQEIGRRLADALSSLIAFRSLRESERKLEAAQRIARVGWWERDFRTNRVSLSDEVRRTFGVDPVDLPHWDERWVNVIHPEDRPKTAAAAAAALDDGPPYDVEYRVVRPDGSIRVVHSQGEVIRDESGRPVRQFGMLQDITDLRQTERRLEEAQRMARVGWWERDLVAGRVAFSDEVWEFYGIPPQDRLADLAEWQRRLPTLIHEEDREKALGALAASLAGGHRVEVTYRVVRPDGTMRVGRGWGDTTLDEAGRPLRQFGVVQDITELWQVEQELRESEARFRKLTDLSADWYWRQDENLRFTYAVDEKAGYSAPVSLGKTRWELPVTPLSASWDEHRAVLAARQPFRDFQYSRIDSDGGTRYISVSGVPVFDERGAFKGYDGVASDITPRKRAEGALRASEARFRTFVDHATDAFFLLDEQLLVVDVNRQACAGLGYSREELIGMHPRDFDVGLDERSIAQLGARVGAGETVTFETVHQRKDGVVFPVEIRARAFQQGEHQLILCLVRDISERKRAEHELRASEERFRTLVQFSFDVYWETDAQHRFTRQEFIEGLADAPEPGSEIGKTRWEVPYLEPDEEAWRKHRATLDAHLPFRDFEIARPAADGGKRYVSTSGLPMFDETGRFIGYRGVGRHITERKRAEQELQRLHLQLVHMSRVMTTAELASSIAHEVNQPLGSIVASVGPCLRWLNARPPDLDNARRALERIAHDGERAGSIINRIRALVRREPPRQERVDLNEVISEVIALTRDQMRSNHISLTTELAAELKPVLGDKVQLQQVMLNLIVNAIDAMSAMPAGRQGLAIVSVNDGVNGVRIEVRDSGPGIEPERAEQLFEPFYTTKPQGIGMGLWISRSIIEAHQGSLRATANVPHGAVFQFALPVAQSAPGKSARGERTRVNLAAGNGRR